MSRTQSCHIRHLFRRRIQKAKILTASLDVVIQVADPDRHIGPTGLIQHPDHPIEHPVVKREPTRIATVLRTSDMRTIFTAGDGAFIMTILTAFAARTHSMAHRGTKGGERRVDPPFDIHRPVECPTLREEGLTIRVNRHEMIPKLST